MDSYLIDNKMTISEKDSGKIKTPEKKISRSSGSIVKLSKNSKISSDNYSIDI